MPYIGNVLNGIRSLILKYYNLGRDVWYSIPGLVRMPMTWIGHWSVVCGAGLLLGSLGAGLAFLFYVYREIKQHLEEGTRGYFQWLDRVMDLIFPLGALLLFL